MVHITALRLAFLLSLFSPTPRASDVFSTTIKYPLPNQGNVVAHDPSIVEYDNYFYLFKGGVGVPVHRAARLDGPWGKIGKVLNNPSVIEKVGRERPWAPTAFQWESRFYCLYCVTERGKRNSAIGLASSDSIEPGNWTDHGALINTGTGYLADIYPYNESNAIDPAFFSDPRTGIPYMQYGSFWDGVFQIPLTDNMTIEDPTRPDASHLLYVPDLARKAEEGSFMSYKAPYYYLWFSHGDCCQFANGFPPKGDEYSIRMGRSTNVHGPFVDKDGTDLLDGGGTVVYGSNHGTVYAPGGIGILTETDAHPDIMYFHYLNTSIGFTAGDARLGWNYLDYVDGWPEAQGTENTTTSLRPNMLKFLFVQL